MSDPKRIADLVAVVNKMPRGSAVIYRHFGEPERRQTADVLRQITFDRDMQLLIGKDVELAHAIGADGVHLPEIDLVFAISLRSHYPDWIVTIAAHTEQTLVDAARWKLDAAIFSPVFVSDSPSAGLPTGVEKFTELVALVDIPVFALGGINIANATVLRESGAAGLAGISGFVG